MASVINPEVLKLLACPRPVCRGELVHDGDSLACQACGVRYPLTDGWPVLIPPAEPHEPSADSPE